MLSWLILLLVSYPGWIYSIKTNFIVEVITLLINLCGNKGLCLVTYVLLHCAFLSSQSITSLYTDSSHSPIKPSYCDLLQGTYQVSHTLVLPRPLFTWLAVRHRVKTVHGNVKIFPKSIFCYTVFCSEISEPSDNHNNSLLSVTTHILDVPLGYYVALYLLGPFHLILSFWMLAEYFVEVMPNLSFRLPIVIEKEL